MNFFIKNPNLTKKNILAGGKGWDGGVARVCFLFLKRKGGGGGGRVRAGLSKRFFFLHSIQI